MGAFISDILLPAVRRNQLGLAVGLGVVVVGLLLIGRRDLMRLNLRRAWAIGSVCLKESLRRRVLWVTPVVMLAVVGVSQFVIGTDPADELRQVTGYCFFASGLVAVLTCLILACTNLPRDMESKVIFTVVTKPPSRLEVVLGKVMGFSVVAALVLGVMGVFTVGWMSVLAAAEQRAIAAELEAGTELARRGELEHYARVGLLGSRDLAVAEGVQLYAEEPTPDQAVVWIAGLAGQDAVVPYDLPPVGFLFDPDRPTAEPGADGLRVLLDLEYQDSSGGPLAVAPRVRVQFLDADGFLIPEARALPDDGVVRLRDDGPAMLVVPPEPARALVEAGRFLIKVEPLGGARLGFDRRTEGTQKLPPVTLVVPEPPAEDPDEAREGRARPLRPDGEPVLRGRPGQFGQQLIGPVSGLTQVAVYRFRDADVSAEEEVTVEMRFGLQGAGEDVSSLAQLTLTPVNLTTGERFEPVLVTPESLRRTFATVPAAAVAGGDFDLVARNLSPGRFVGVTDGSVAVVAGRGPFAGNVLKSFAGLWLLCVLVVCIAVFCSTFLSWPIAVVLATFLLGVRWAVDQVRDVLRPGFSQQIGGDLFRSSAAGAEATEATVTAITDALKLVASLLPDLSPFGTGRFLAAGQSVPLTDLGYAALVTALFGLPLVVLGYVFLRYREVAK